MKDTEWLKILEEFSDEFDDALENLGFGDLKNGNVEKILADDGVTKVRYLLVKEAEARILERFPKLKDSREKLEGLSENIVRWEKATGGEVIHRGFYNPSPVADIVIGRNGRGKLLVRPTKRSNITYEYGFDEGGRMLKAVTHTEVGDFSEYFVHENDSVFAVCFDPDGQVYSVCEEIYKDGKINSFTIVSFDGVDERSSVQHECFEYDEKGHLMKSEMLEICILSFKKDMPENISHRIYEFISDSEGYLEKYNLVYDESPAFKRDDVWYDVKIKRKA